MQTDLKKPEPTYRQLSAITAPPGPLMILAGAGTGKTFTILQRVLRQVTEGRMRPDQVVILTYTEKATRDLLRKLRNLDFPEAEDLTVATFHSFCIRIIKEFNPDILANKTLIGQGDHLFLLARKIDDMNFLSSPVFRSDPLKAIWQSFIPFFSRARDELYTPEDLRKKISAMEGIENEETDSFPGVSPKVIPEERQLQLQDLVTAYAKYQEWKEEQGYLDYGDMILNCWKIIRNDTDVVKEVRSRHRHFIIDEYQDNNYALNRIIKRIVEENPSVTVVGDQDQCIYSFRGANYYTVMDFETTYLRKLPERKVTLEENFRSTREILDLANAVISQDQNRVAKRLVSSQGRSGPRPVWHVAENSLTPEVVLKLIRQAISAGRSYDELAVLCRTTAKVKEISQTLERQGIPVDSFVDYFFGVPAIRDILAWSEVLVEGEYFGPALGRLLNSVSEAGMESELENLRNIRTLEKLS
ncbi:MAG: ATP-dependent helicase, partial [Fidelibacterota bacterium]